MPKGRWSPEQSSSSWWLVAVFCLSMALQWLEPKMDWKVPVAYPLNKLGLASDLLSLGDVVFFFLCHHGGGKAEVAKAWIWPDLRLWGVEAFTLDFFRRASSADILRRRPAILLLTLMVVRRTLRFG
jgi:hypothetical protein